MEDILQVYCRPYNARHPLICVDEMGKNLVAEKRDAEAMKPGQVKREDYTYEKQGSANVFVATEPLVGKRVLKVTHQRTKKDFALFLQDILEKHYSEAEKVIVVMDNLNTHKPASFYETFPPAQARALLDRLEFHYTPKHASWLNMAEIEFSILVRQVESWQNRRNDLGTVVHWHFTTADARVKLARLYPVIEEEVSPD